MLQKLNLNAQTNAKQCKKEKRLNSNAFNKLKCKERKKERKKER